MKTSSAGQLQHPRRSLGNRHRAQARKFLNLISGDCPPDDANLAWAEQAARQAVLYDFTHEDNWLILAETKKLAADDSGMRAVITDLFTILGRDPLMVDQLASVNMVEHGFELVAATLAADPLDPDYWFESIGEEGLGEFQRRFFSLDLSDVRANILFGRRLERIRTIDEDMFITMVQRLLAHRPYNHEAWVELGRLHERRKEFDEAWFCYDQAQIHFPQLDVRDSFRIRMERKLDGTATGWSRPTESGRDEFLRKMENLALKTQSSETAPPAGEKSSDSESGESESERLQRLMVEGEFSSAFFLARRLVTSGEDWASEYLEQAQANLRDEGSDSADLP